MDKVYLTPYKLNKCKSEARKWFPLETGGVFLGWQNADGSTRISHILGAGPQAIHGYHEFQCDYEWQNEEIRRIYFQYDRKITYLGDWHSHPNSGSGLLSQVDKAVLRLIIETPRAQCTNPIMAIFYGSLDKWKVECWRALLVRSYFGWKKLTTSTVPLVAEGGD